jgi:hypothetical protein
VQQETLGAQVILLKINVMKAPKITSNFFILTLLLVSLPVFGQQTLTNWTFANGDLLPDTGTGSASIVGNLNQSFPNSTYGKCLQLTNFATQSTQNGQMGVAFQVSTVGKTNINLQFSQRASGPASRWVQLDYSLDGSTWVTGFWTNSGAILPQDTWLTFNVDFSDEPGVANNPNFKVRLVSIFSPFAFDQSNNSAPYASYSAYMCADACSVFTPSTSSCHATYSTNGSWRFDNVSILGVALPVLAAQVLSSSLSAQYGVSSAQQACTLSGTNLLGTITATPQTGFEISLSSNTGFVSTPIQNISSGTILYVRTLSNKPVGTFNNTVCIQLTSLSAASSQVSCSATGNAISQRPLLITANDVQKELGATLSPVLGSTAFTTSWMPVNESISTVDISYGSAAAASGTSVGVYPNQVFAANPVGVNLSWSNYILSFQDGSLQVTGFMPGDLLVNRIGDGLSPLGSITFPLSLVEYLPSGSTLQEVAQQFSSSNLLTETGELNSSNGHLNSNNEYLGVPGYDLQPGVPNVASYQAKATNILNTGASVSNRVVFPASGQAVPFVNGYLTSLLPLNSNQFYAAGTGDGTSGGVWYFDGSAFIQLNSNVLAGRSLEIFNGNLYFSTSVSPAGIYQLGTGLPTTANQTVQLLIASASPRGFALSPDGQLAYIADDSPVNGNVGGGIQKWVLQNNVWTKLYTHGQRSSGLTADFSDTIAKVYATTFLVSPGADNNKLLKIIDTNAQVLPIELASAGTNFIYKGIDFAPAAAPVVPLVVQVEQPTCQAAQGKVHLNGLPSGNWKITGAPFGTKTGNGSSAIIENLPPGHTYTFKVSSFTGRTSGWSASVQINPALTIPATPSGAQLQKLCQNAVVQDLSLNETSLLWYSNAQSQTAIPTQTPLVHNNQYYAAQVHPNGCQSANRLAVTAQVLNPGEWKGAAVGSWKNQANWCGGVPAAGASVEVPTATTILLDSAVLLSNLYIPTGAALQIKPGEKLTLSEDLLLDGELHLKNGATLVQESNSTWMGTGNAHMQQFVTGTGGLVPSGRFWYLGSPSETALSGNFFAEGVNVLKYYDEPSAAWLELTTANAPIIPGRGYFLRVGANDTLNFSSIHLNNGSMQLNCTRTTGVASEGFNLVSNPYPSYLNWDDVLKANIGNTIWYRSHDGGNMVFDTYVANANGGIGTSLNGQAVSKLIPPLQSFWVRVNPGSATGSLTLNNSMRAHFSSYGGSTAGLKTMELGQRLFLRMNLNAQDKKDQLIIYVNNEATNGFDALDGEKMLQANGLQCYTAVGAKKIVINGLNAAKLAQSVPVILEIPTTGICSLSIENLEIDNGLVWLEDKQENVTLALDSGAVYEFYANAGLHAERFVLHFALVNNSPTGTTYNELDSAADFCEKETTVHAETAGVVVIKIPEASALVKAVQIRDAAGKLVYDGPLESLENRIALQVANGIYYVALISDTAIDVRKIFIEQ